MNLYESSKRQEDPTGVDQMVRDQETREAREVAPDSANVLRASENAIRQLEQLLSTNPSALEHLTALSERVLFFLQRDGEPSPLAIALTKPKTDLGINQLAEMRQLKQMAVSEINPILYSLRKTIKDQIRRAHKTKRKTVNLDLPKIENLLAEEKLAEALGSGAVENQKTTSFFGMLEGVSSRESVVPKALVILDPLSEDEENAQYWADQMHAMQKLTGKIEGDYSSLVAGRSEYAAAKLDIASEEFDRSGDSKASEACMLLAEFLDEKAAELAGDFKAEAKVLSVFNPKEIGLKPDDIIKLLSAAETVKHANPQLYAALVGIAPGRADAQATRSDLYGNAFHILLQKSLENKTVAANAEDHAGKKVIQDYLKNLAKTDSKQMPLTQLSRAQLDQKQERLLAEVQKTDGTRNDVLYIGLLHEVASAAATAPAREFLGRISEVKEKEKEEGSYKKDVEIINWQRSQLYGDRDMHRQGTTELARVLAHRGNIEGALQLVDALWQIGVGRFQGINPDPRGSWSDKIYKQVFQEIPIEQIQKNPDAYIQKLDQREMLVVVPDLINRLVEAGDLTQAHELALYNLEQNQLLRLHDTSDLSLVASYISCTRDTATAEIDAGLYDESVVLETELNKIRGGASKSILEIRAHRAKAFARAGMFYPASKEVRNLEHGPLQQEAIDAIVEEALAMDKYEAAWDACFGEGASVLSSKSAADVLIRMHEEGKDITEKYEQWKALITSDDYKYERKIKDSIQLARIDHETGGSTSEYLDTLLKEVRGMGDHPISLMFRVDLLKAFKTTNSLATYVEISSEINRVYQTLVVQYRDQERSGEIFKELVTELCANGDTGLAVQVAHEPLGAKDFRDRLSRHKEVLKQMVESGHVITNEDLDEMAKPGSREVLYEVVVPILIESGHLGEAWKMALKIPLEESNATADTRLREVILARIETTGQEEAETLGEKVLGWANEIQNKNKRPVVFERFVRRFGPVNQTIVERLDNSHPELWLRMQMEMLSEAMEDGRAQPSIEKKIKYYKSGRGDQVDSVAFLSEVAVAQHKDDDGFFSDSRTNLRVAYRRLGSDLKDTSHQEREKAAEYIALAHARMGEFKKAFEAIEKPVLPKSDRQVRTWKKTTRLKIIEIFRERYTA